MTGKGGGSGVGSLGGGFGEGPVIRNRRLGCLSLPRRRRRDGYGRQIAVWGWKGWMNERGKKGEQKGRLKTEGGEPQRHWEIRVEVGLGRREWGKRRVDCRGKKYCIFRINSC